MASVLAFDGIGINGTTYGRGNTNTAVFVPGSGTITSTKRVARTPVEDGTIEYDVHDVDISVSFSLYGDLTSLETSANDQDKFEITHKALAGSVSTILTIYGVSKADYDDDSKQTTFSISGKSTNDALGADVVIDSSSADS